MKKTLLAALMTGLFTLAYAQVPSTLSYQGILVKTSPPADAGKPVDDGTHFVRFRFYTTPTGGTPVYSSTGTGSGNSVTTFKGMFSFIIGSGTPGNDPIPASIFNNQLYVEIEADGVTFPTRIPLTTTPYSFVAQTANTMDAANLSGTLDPARIAAGAIDNSKLASGIDASKLTTGTLPAARIGNDAIDNAKLADNAVNTAEIANNAVTSAKIADGTIVTVDLADASVTSAKIADGAVAAVDIADGAVTLAKHADNSVNSAKIVDASIATTDLADNSVTSAKIVDASVATIDLADNAVTSAKIADGAITAAKLATGAALNGVGMNNRIAFWSGSHTLTATDKLSTDGSNLGIGIATPGNFLHVAADASTSSIATFEGHSTTATRGPGISFLRSKGSLITPAAVVNGDYLGGISASGRTASAYNLSSSISFEVDGFVAGTSVPGRVVFSTTTAGSTTSTEKMRLTSDGVLGLGISSPNNGMIHINGTTSLYSGIHFTHPASGFSASDGFLIGPLTINNNELVIWNWENAPITFATGGSARMSISASGRLSLSDASWSINDLTLSSPTSSAGSSIRFTNSAPGNRTYDIIGSTGEGATMGAGYFGIWDNTGSGYRFVIAPSGAIGIGVINPIFRLDLPNVASDVGGRGRSNSWVTYSDNRVKSNQKSLEYGLREILMLKPKKYIHHSSSFQSGKLILNEGVPTLGLIAQEVYPIIPEIVYKPDDESKDLWSLDYPKLVPVLIKAIQEQQEVINNHANMISELKAEIDLLKKLMVSRQSSIQASSVNGNE